MCIRRPDHILQRATSRIHVETVVIQNLCREQIVMRLLYECVLRSLECVFFSSSDTFPARGKWRATGFEILKISKPGKSALRYETSRHSHFACHLIGPVRNTARMSRATRH